MRRRTFDALAAEAGLILAVILVVAGVLSGAQMLMPHFADICMATAATPIPTASETASPSHRVPPPGTDIVRPPAEVARRSSGRAESNRGRRGA